MPTSAPRTHFVDGPSAGGLRQATTCQPCAKEHSVPRDLRRHGQRRRYATTASYEDYTTKVRRRPLGAIHYLPLTPAAGAAHRSPRSGVAARSCEPSANTSSTTRVHL